MVIGRSITEVEPTTVDVLAQESLVYGADTTLLAKLKDVGVEIQAISPTSVNATTYSSGIGGGTVSPLGTSGQVISDGGIRLVQNLQGGPSTTVTLGAIGVDLAAKTAGAEVIGESTAETEGRKPLNVGNLGRGSIADLTITANTQSPATRSVSVSATATIQPVAAEVLEGLVKIYQGYVTAKATKELEAKGAPAAEAARLGGEAAAKRVENDQIKAGESLGSFSFTAIGE